MDYATRRDRLRRGLQKVGVEALLVTDFVNVTYLTGFTGDDSYLLLRARGGETLLSDGRYTTQLAEQCPGLDLSIRAAGEPIHAALGRLLKASKLGRLAVEADSMTLGLRQRIAEHLPSLQVEPIHGAVEKLRQVKDREEIALIREAIDLAERAFGVLRATIRPEQTEKQLADELEHQMRRFGASREGFPCIVGVGPRAALPHATPGGSRVADDDFVLVDWGARWAGYHSDLTRVLVTGRISRKFREIYATVFEAQRRAIAAIRPGATAQQVDAAARRFIAEAGYGRWFDHGLGHGIGLEIHEAPRLTAQSDLVLKAGMVVTVEPGIYLPGWGGVRLEDDVLVTRQGAEVLTSLPKQLDQIVLH